MKNLTLICFLIFSSPLFAQEEFLFKHLDCKVRYNTTSDFLSQLANKKLVDKNYTPQPFVDGNKMNVGDLYFQLEYKRDPRKLWRDCIVKISIKKATNQKAMSKDKTLFSRSVTRSLPRHTFSGDERCKRGLSDAFVNIPPCQKMTVNEKVKGN